jgi:VanZ family protein
MPGPSPLARYLFIAYALLIVYASLYPFSGWRAQGLVPFAFVTAPFPRLVSAFDVVANVVGYLPLGFVAVLAVYPVLTGRGAFMAAALFSLLLSFTLESIQFYLPSRTSSNLDLLANVAGGALGALSGLAAIRPLLREDGLQALRHRLFLPGGRTDLGLVLLGLWLFAQLYPGTLLFGTGDLRDLVRPPSGRLYPAELFLRVEAGVACANGLAAGLLVSCLTARHQPARTVVLAVIAAALVVRSLAYGLLVGSQDFLAWVTPGAVYGVSAAVVLCMAAVALPGPVRLALTGLALLAATALVNLAPANPYNASTLALWQQGHYLNFNGVTRVVSTIWPFAAMVYLVLLAAERDRPGSRM